MSSSGQSESQHQVVSIPAASRSQAAPHFALIAVQLMFGSWPISGKIALRFVPSVALLSFRIGGAAVVFIILQRLLGQMRFPAKRDITWIALYSLLGIVLNQFLFIKGLSLTTVIDATLLGTTIPVFTLLVSIIFGLDQLTWRKAMGILLAAGGVVYLVDPLRANFSGQTALGNLLIVANSIAYGAYIALSKQMVKRYGALTFITWVFVFGTVVTLPIGLTTIAIAPIHGGGLGVWLVMLYIILVPTVGAYYANAWALARVAPSTVAVYIYLQPLIAFVMAPLILGESWNSRTWIASILIFAGVAIVIKRSRSPAVADVAERPEALGH
ncbi:MAG: hypothetical protein QOF02_1475 [Blastocatellia bacterium]|nr:hypothetical protein [Blastocatellia bacterium]